MAALAPSYARVGTQIVSEPGAVAMGSVRNLQTNHTTAACQNRER